MSTDEAQPFLGDGPAVRRSKRQLLFAAIGLLLVIGLVLGDWWQAKREMDHLLVAVVVSKIATATGFRSVIAMRGSEGDDTSRRAIQAKCATAAANVQDTNAQVSEVFVLPWHRSLGTARDAYLAHGQAWEDIFAGCADDLMRWNDGSKRAHIDASGRVAYRAFIRAVPAADGRRRNSVEAVFKDDVTGAEWAKVVGSVNG